MQLTSAETSAPRTPNRGGPRTKRGPCKWSVRSTIYSTYDKGALNKPILRFNIFFVLTHAMWGPIPYLYFDPANFSKNSSRKTNKQTFSSIPRAPNTQAKGAKISLKNVFSWHR